MDAPFDAMSFDDFARFMTKQVTRRYRATRSGLVCQTCSALIQYAVCCVAIHYEEISLCADTGLTLCIPLPYCLACEGIPTKTTTCAHVFSSQLTHVEL